MVTIRHEFLERYTGYKYPVVAHEFQGQTLQEVIGYFRAHMKYDRMLRSSTGLLADGALSVGRFQNIEFKSLIRIKL